MVDCWHFGSFELRLSTRTLRRGAEPVALGGRAFDLLVALVEQRDRVVARNELVERVWPHTEVEENNLAVQVLALRRVLGKDAIATVPGRGYRFTLPVQGDTGTANEDAAAAGLQPLAPAALSRLFGRDDDLRILQELLEVHRLVTLVGAGGAGKSTLAAALCRQTTDPADSSRSWVWVDLDPIDDAALLASQIARAFGLQVGRDVEAHALAAALRSVDALLVLDSAEHLVDAAAPLVHALLAGVPRLRLLVTSQVPLKIEGEHVLRLGTLSVPAPGTATAQAMQHGAVALFVEQVRAADPRCVLGAVQIAAIVDLCRRLDGLPLAIKLAAARVPLLGLHELGLRLDQSLRLLAGGQRDRPTRQQTLRAALDWSHELLTPDEQAVFRRLGVFNGGFTLGLGQATAAVDSIDALAVVECVATLVERSLVMADAADPPRYRLLSSAREYALLELDAAGERAATQGRHARALTASIEHAATQLHRQPLLGWLAAHEPEIDNLRAAIGWACEQDATLAIALLGAAEALFAGLNLRPQFQQCCAALDAAARQAPPSAAVARYWYARSLSLVGTHHVEVQRHAQQAEALHRKLDDRFGLYRVLCLRLLGITADPSVPYVEMLAEANALEQKDWPVQLLAWGHIARCSYLLAQGQFESAHGEAEAGIRAADKAGVDWHASVLRNLQAMCDLYRGRAAQALQTTLRRAAPSRYAVGFVALTQGLHAHALINVRRLDEARHALRTLFDGLRVTDWDSIDYFCDTFVQLALVEGRHADAAKLIGYAEAAKSRAGLDWPRSAARLRRLQETISAAAGAACEEWVAQGRVLGPEAVCETTLHGG